MGCVPKLYKCPMSILLKKCHFAKTRFFKSLHCGMLQLPISGKGGFSAESNVQMGDPNFPYFEVKPEWLTGL